MRQEGGGLGYEPEPPPPSPPDVAADGPPADAPEPVAAPLAPAHRFAPPPFVGAPASTAADAPRDDDDARFRPPPAHADDDARFAPPAAHLAAAPAGLQGTVARPTLPLLQELGKILAFPVSTSFGLFMVSAGAALLFFVYLVVLNPVGIVPLPALIALLPVIFYIYSYLVCVTESASQGKEELPDWPDIGSALGLAWRIILATVASFAPAALTCCLLFKADWSGPDRRVRPTIGPQAVNLAGTEGLVAVGTAAGDAGFVTLDGDPTVLTGRWTVLGLLGKDMVDETGTDEAFAAMPSAGFGVVIDHMAQIYDLDRVGQALEGEVNVLAAYADPRCKIVWGRHPYAVPEAVREQRGYGVSDASADEGPGEAEEAGGALDDPDDLEAFDMHDETQAALRRARGTAERNAIAQGAPARRPEDPANNPFKTIRFVRSDDYVFPAPFTEVRRLPAVYVLDPRGVVRREYATGVHDEQLYGDLLDLMGGGDGDALPASLPASTYGEASQVVGSAGKLLGVGLLGLLLLFAVFYFPMALLLMVAFNDGWMAFQYPAGLRAIGAATKDYLVVAGLFVGTSVFGWVLKLVMSVTLSRALPSSIAWLLRDYLNQWIWFYGALVAAYAVGRFYYRNREAIGWFTVRR